jgi:hypothetical protein
MKNSKISTPWRGRVSFALACLLSLLISVFAIEACKPVEKPTDVTGISPVITPQDLDPTLVQGFHFPEDPDRIKDWAVMPDSAYLMYRHGWGLWTAITAPSSEAYMGQKLSVFETWLTSTDIIAATVRSQNADAVAMRTDPRPLRKLTQLQHQGAVATEPKSHGAETVLGLVKYNPAAANHIMTHRLFDKATLEGMQAEGKTDVPPFPADAVVLKVLYTQIDPKELKDDRYFKMAVWTGPQHGAVAYPVDEWDNVVWIDLENGSGDSEGKSSQEKDETRQENSTYNIDDFIHFRLTKPQAQRLTEESRVAGENITYEEGRYFVLNSLHIITREIEQWTWQSYYWEPTPTNPYEPSSAAIAAEMPSELGHAARHYAMTVGYSMISTNQPLTGGKEEGTPVYCYGPYLEAPFDAADMPASKAWTYQGKTYNNTVGVQSNCMSCHAYAATPFEMQPMGNGSLSLPAFSLYTGDRYVDLNDPLLKGKLRSDFLWSIPVNSASVAGPSAKK